MRLDSMVPFRATLLGLTVAIGAAASSDGLSQEYCSSENTASDYSAVYNIYQSNGACHDQCVGSYAFAIVQYQDCWCSDYIPEEQQSVSDCNQDCPGYPADKCGNASEGLYGYIALSKQPSGTAGAASSSAASSTVASSSSSQPSTTTTQQSSTSEQTSTSSSQQQQTSYVSQTVYQTVTQSQSQSPTTVVSYVTLTPATTSTSHPSTSSTYSSPTSSSSTTSYASTSSSTTIVPVIVPAPATTEASSSLMTSSATPSPVTSVRVVTISGAAVTQTVTSIPNSDPDSVKLQRKGLSGGAIAGIAIGTLLGVAALLFGAFLLWRRRKQNSDAEGVDADHAPSKFGRTASVLSKTGLLSRGRPVSVMEKDLDDPLYVNTHTGQNSVRHSMMLAAGGAGDGISPVSPLGGYHDNDSSQRRHSRPLVYDQRLNPSALFMNADANGSRVSMQDHQDYTRPLNLGVMNPTRPSFESRDSSRS